MKTVRKEKVARRHVNTRYWIKYRDPWYHTYAINFILVSCKREVKSGYFRSSLEAHRYHVNSGFETAYDFEFTSYFNFFMQMNEKASQTIVGLSVICEDLKIF